MNGREEARAPDILIKGPKGHKGKRAVFATSDQPAASPVDEDGWHLVFVLVFVLAVGCQLALFSSSQPRTWDDRLSVAKLLR